MNNIFIFLFSNKNFTKKFIFSKNQEEDKDVDILYFSTWNLSLNSKQIEGIQGIEIGKEELRIFYWQLV